MDEKIDFVIIWVDGNDLEWLSEFNKYAPYSKKTDDISTIRYRDWDNLRYWFRGVEQFTPWVNKVHFVTAGHYPKWLNLKAEKLNFVSHKDYIPIEYLPVFNANPIEINLHRIKGLADKFVFFNDDFFLINHVSPERFFKNGLPCDMAICNAVSSTNYVMSHINVNNVNCLNSVFNKKNVLLKNWVKWFNLKYGLRVFRTVNMLPWKYFSAFYVTHLPNGFLKQTFYDVWNHFEDSLNLTSKSRFRSISDNNQYLFRYWQLLTGNFTPMDVCKDSRYMSISDNTIDEIEKIIESQTKNILVLNDSDNITDFESVKSRINNSFCKILPNKSSFEI